ncbi:hypothetical protein HQN89_34015 [Paenibacillus frigoriresistens]|uniref:hypothetical protein n=1 Tax=Paenibacillus alginolyticus TaxID=59839 RepID=UPI001566A5F3|nr:hypothetical protein [Paenibacillus frigoriresistens]NRF95830.1 hypothetical protein [Paenibacillus frigoriresistens]
MFKRFRSRNEMNNFIFGKFIDYLKDYGRPIPSSNRYLKMDEQQRQECSDIDFLEKTAIATNFTASLFKLNGKRFFAVTGLEQFSTYSATRCQDSYFNIAKV